MKNKSKNKKIIAINKLIFLNFEYFLIFIYNKYSLNIILDWIKIFQLLYMFTNNYLCLINKFFNEIFGINKYYAFFIFYQTSKKYRYYYYYRIW